MKYTASDKIKIARLIANSLGVEDVFSCVAHGLVAGDQVVFSATQGSLPTGLTSNTVYFVIASGLSADAFKVSASVGGSSIDMSGSATGTYQFLRQGVTELDVIGFSANRLVGRSSIRVRVVWGAL